MQSDRELLELAAKAIHNPENYANIPYMDGWYSRWNPLTDDGAALRLACALCMTISTCPVSAQVNTIAGALRGFSAVEAVKQEQAQAVRRAIVLAAAEIGRNME